LTDRDAFTRLVRSVFTQRRKTIGNALKGFAAETGQSAAEILKSAGINPQRRPETLELAEFAALARPAGPSKSRAGEDG
jgi:16S rRNA (adenine1518-N6/adenine1519-N6)-dimethyltransferase